MEKINYTHVVKRLFLRDYFSGKNPTIVDYIEKYRIVLDIDDFVNWGLEFAFLAVKSVYKTMGDNELHLYCLEKSAQAWCKDSTKKLEMIPELAEEFASILFEEISNTIDKGKNMSINEETKKSHLKDLKNYCFHDQILGSHELHKIKQHIVEWRESGSGINSALAQPIVDCILILCQEVRNISIKNTDEELPENHPYHPDHVSENYSKPIQTGVNQWSVFVRKYKGHTDCVGVIEHRFKTEDNAQAFSVNNWNLGEYY